MTDFKVNIAKVLSISFLAILSMEMVSVNLLSHFDANIECIEKPMDAEKGDEKRQEEKEWVTFGLNQEFLRSSSSILSYTDLHRAGLIRSVYTEIITPPPEQRS